MNIKHSLKFSFNQWKTWKVLFLWWIGIGTINVVFGYENLISLVFLLIPIIYGIGWKQPLQYWICTIGLIILMMALGIFIPHEWELTNLFTLINSNLGFSIRDAGINYVDQNYSIDSATIIKALIFNEKNYEHDFFQNLNRLDVIHLFVVSGVHINLLIMLINKCFKKFKWIRISISFIICSFLFYLTGFSISILRIIIGLILRLFLRWSNLQLSLLNGIIVNLCFSNDANNYGCLMSYVATIFISFLISIIKNKIILAICINCCTPLILLPIVTNFNHNINILYFLNGIILSGPILFLYYFEMMICWLPFIFEINDQLLNFVSTFISTLSQYQIEINLKINEILVIISYFILGNIVCIFYDCDQSIRQSISTWFKKYKMW